MNKILLISILGICNVSNVQFDDRFYLPSKEYSLLEENHSKNLFFEVDSDKIHTLWLKPNEKPTTTILFFVGASGNPSHYTPTKPLVNEGYQMLLFEPRGCGLSTGTPKHLNEILDAQMVLDSLVSLSEIKDTKSFIYGASLGSQAATYITKNIPDNIDALIIDGGMSSFTDIALITSADEPKEMWVYQGGHLRVLKVDKSTFVQTITHFITSINN
jgi:alpha-beta hydrolase superfamily lysophospholipase